MSTDWQDRPDLFADYGSVLRFPCGAPGDVYTAEQLGAQSIAVVAYGVPQSAAACQAAVKGMRQFGLHVSFSDLNFVYGADPTADVLQMKAKNVDLLFTCLDVNGNVAFARAISQNGLNMKQVWFNGYDRGTLAQYGSIMNGVYLGVQHVPFEAALAYPGAYPGLDTYIQQMEKYQPKYTYDEVALDGWIAADQFVTGPQSGGAQRDPEEAGQRHQPRDRLHRGRPDDPGELGDGPQHAHAAVLPGRRAGGERRLRAGVRPGDQPGVHVLRGSEQHHAGARAQGHPWRDLTHPGLPDR